MTGGEDFPARDPLRQSAKSHRAPASRSTRNDGPNSKFSVWLRQCLCRVNPQLLWGWPIQYIDADSMLALQSDDPKFIEGLRRLRRRCIKDGGRCVKQSLFIRAHAHGRGSVTQEAAMVALRWMQARSATPAPQIQAG